jgi:3-hydroxyacyl-[acyl-carrier-protein] dehydratase
MHLTQVDIKKILPHRYSMAMVDAVSELESGVRIVAHKAITVTEACYADIADDADARDYAYPQSLIVESFCQAGGIMYAHQKQAAGGGGDGVMLFGSMGGIEFLADAYPGDVLEHRVSLTKSLSDAVVFEGEVRVRNQKIVEIGQVLAAIRPAEILQR